MYHLVLFSHNKWLGQVRAQKTSLGKHPYLLTLITYAATFLEVISYLSSATVTTGGFILGVIRTLCRKP